MEQEEIQVVAFEIILHSGTARTNIHDAFKNMREDNYELAEQILDEANQEITLAHQSQTDLLQKYASGESINMEIIMVHAQDHLMTTMTLREVAIEMLHLYKKVNDAL
ncbi:MULTISPECIES: PTS cellobiose transporter subunit IIA [Mammaliicoccus]|uniref:PTS cellobiose transporter subunit IIA n=1 Tax=Mammaliicoccus TaxID=2803850 RepID=UPI000DFCFF08|nr:MULTISPECIES: PTS cellobiose transporter subunit IIA [Mammaliicoccus]RTX85494.1 PTS cellobiose transporter subunit IIA [Mammaliicoccus fleurettii]SUM37517.1 PTS system lactose-specific transporter subunit IIA [Mammaliicoccus fleurettii]HCN60745.1 PTS cellobiose transporter subunit IIA [Staphylococcus sp.]